MPNSELPDLYQLSASSRAPMSPPFGSSLSLGKMTKTVDPHSKMAIIPDKPSTKSKSLKFGIDRLLSTDHRMPKDDTLNLKTTCNYCPQSILESVCCFPSYTDLSMYKMPTVILTAPEYRNFASNLSNYYSYDQSQYTKQASRSPELKSKKIETVKNDQQNDTNSLPQSSVGAKRKRSWSRAVFSNLQRKGLEKRFLKQKYITKPDRRQLAASLGLTDAQVKVWFQNRRMKWRHSQKMSSNADDVINLANSELENTSEIQVDC